MLPDDVKVTRVTEQTLYGADLQPSTFIRVEFTVGKHGPFVEKFPKADYTADARDYKLTAFATQVR